jgi:hypothetical protein
MTALGGITLAHAHLNNALSQLLLVASDVGNLPRIVSWVMPLELAFATEALRDVCENEAIAKKELGAKVADALKRRLSDFQSIDTFDELPFAKPKKSSNNCLFELPDGWQLTVTSGHAENPKLGSGRIDWSQVSRLKILKIEKRR